MIRYDAPSVGPLFKSEPTALVGAESFASRFTPTLISKVSVGDARKCVVAFTERRFRPKLNTCSCVFGMTPDKVISHL